MNDNWAAAFSASDGVAVYDNQLVPRIFEPWAKLLLDELKVSAGEHILDVATGPGTVARLAAAAVGPAGKVVACDLSAAMLDLARNKPALENSAPIIYLECPADDLDVGDASYDVITCQQGLQFFPDRAAALAEMRRAARPNARIGIATWGPITDCPMFAAVAFAVGQVIGSEKAERYRSGPWGLTDETTLTSLVESAQFSAVEVRSHTLPVTVEGGTRQLMQTLFTSAVVDEIRELGDDDRARLCEAAATRLGLNSDTAPVESYMTSNITTARA